MERVRSKDGLSPAELEEMGKLRDASREYLDDVAGMCGLDLDPAETNASLIERIVRVQYFSCSGCCERRKVQMVDWMFCSHVQGLQASRHLRRGGGDGAAFLSVSMGGDHVFCSSCKQLVKSGLWPSEEVVRVCAGCAMDWLLEAEERWAS